MPSRKTTPATEDYHQWRKTGDNAHRYKALQDLEPVIKSALKTYGGGDDALKTRAYIMASKSLDTYDPGKDVQLDTYVYNNLRGLLRERQERTSAIHIPENVRADSRKVFEFQDQFRNERGREPSLDELADATGLSHKRIKGARQTGGQMTFSEVEGEKGDVTVGERRTRGDIWKDYIYHDLDPVSQKIFEWKTGYGGEDVVSSNKEIAEKLGLSQAAVSQRVTRIVDLLQKGMTPDAS